MRWPVSRTTLDLLLAEKDARIKQLEDAVTTERAERQRLFDTLHPVKQPDAPPPVFVKRELTKVEHAINTAAGENKHLKRYLQSWAARAKAEGMDEDAIVIKILQGDRVDDEEGVEGLA